MIYCFEKAGVLRDENDDNSVIPHITYQDFQQLKDEGVIQGGMIPKLQNSFDAINNGVTQVIITKADSVGLEAGTKITK